MSINRWPIIGCVAAAFMCAGARGDDGFYWGDAWWAPEKSFTGDAAHYWENGAVPSGDGVGYYLKTQCVNLKFTTAVSFRGLDFGDVKFNNSRPQLSGDGLTMTGDAFISGTGYGIVDDSVGCGEIGVVDGVIHGTGSNSFSKRDVGRLTVNARFADFGTIVASGGWLVSSATDGQLFATGNPAFAVRGGIFRWAPALAADAAGAASLGATTYRAGSISWGKGAGASATLTIDSLTSEDSGSTLLIENDGGPAALGETEKLMISTQPSLVNGMLDPGVVTRDKSAESWPIRFTTYDAEKGVVPYPAASMKDLFAAGTGSGDVAVVSETNTLASSKQVAALMIENTAALSIADGATLTVGDGSPDHRAGVVFNMQNQLVNDTQHDFTGAGTLDFGNSPGIIWMASPTYGGWGGNRRIYLKTRITGENGVTFASATRGDTMRSAGIFAVENAGKLCWNGPTCINGCIFWLQGDGPACLPAGDVYVTEGSGWGGQLRIAGGWTLNQNMFLSGRGAYNDGAYVIYLMNNGVATFAGDVTLVDDVRIGSGEAGKGNANFVKGVKGPGGFFFNNGGTYTFNGVNTFGTLFTKKSTTINVGPNATLGTGMVWNKGGALTLNFKRRSEPLQLTNVFRVASGASLSANLDKANVSFAKDVPFKNLKLANFSEVSVGGVLSVDSLRGVGAYDAVLGNFGRDGISANSNNAELRMNVAADTVLGLPISDGSGKLSLTKSGAGTLSLPRVERSYTGATAVKGGTLKLDVSPLECSSLQYWMDASREEDFDTDSSTGAITEWRSRGGSADVKFSVFSGAPSRGTAAKVNGLDVVTTTKTGTTMDRLIANVATEQRTVFIVYRLKTVVNMGGIFGGRDFYSDYGVRIAGESPNSQWDKNVSHYCYNTTGWIRRDGKNGGAVDVGVPHILTLVHDRDNWQPSINWGEPTHGCTFKADLGGYIAGRNYDGDYCEILSFDRVLSESEMRTVENYLSEKWLNKTIWEDLAKPSALPAQTALSVDKGAVLDLNGCSVTVASLTGDGVITNSSETAATLTVTDGGSFGGRLAGPVTLAMGGEFSTGSGFVLPPTNGLAYWCDAALRDSVLMDEGGSVTSWVSRASSSAGALVNTGTMSSGGSNSLKLRPTYSAGALDGRPAIVFNSSGAKALWADVKSGVRTVFVAFATSGTQTGNCAGVWGIGNLDLGFRFNNNSTTLQSGISYVRPTDPNAWVHLDGVSYGNAEIQVGSGVPRVLSIRFDDEHHSESYMRDGLGLGAENATRTTVIGAYVGNPALAGYVGEVIAYDRALTDDEMMRVEKYLIKKWKETDWTEGNPPVMATPSDCGLADGSVTLLAGATVSVVGDSMLGTVSGGGTINGNVTVAEGFDVTVKPDGTTDTLAVNGSVTLGDDAFLRVYNPQNLRDGVFGTFLTATSINGTFVGTNLDKPGAWSVKSTAAKVFKSSASVVFIR